MAVSKEAVFWAYRFFLGRDPESPQVVERHMLAEDERKLVAHMTSSREFIAKRIRDLRTYQGNHLAEEFRLNLQSAFQDFGYGWDHFKEAACDWIAERVPEGSGVDLGGTTYLVKKLNRMKNRSVIFFDYFPPKDTEIEKFVSADMDEFGLHFKPESLDFVTCRHTLEHSLNPLFILWQINRSLKEKGKLLVVVPDHTKGWVWFYSHFSCVPRENWLMLFHRAGFKVLHSDAGTWQPHNPDFIEHRFVLGVETRSLRLRNDEYKDFRI